MPALNHGDELMVPNVPAVTTTTAPRRRRRPPSRFRRRRRAASRDGGTRPAPRADDREVDRDHRQDARRQVQCQPAEENEDDDGEGTAAVEESLLLDSSFGTMDEREEGVTRDVAGSRAGDGESLQRRDILHGWGSCRVLRRHHPTAGEQQQSGAGEPGEPVTLTQRNRTHEERRPSKWCRARFQGTGKPRTLSAAPCCE